MPLLIAAELVVHRRMRTVMRTLLDRQLVPADAMGVLDEAIASAYRLRNSAVVESLLMAFVYVVGITVVWRHYLALDTATWYATPDVAGSSLTPAGIRYGYVGLPIFQFLLVRWYFRLFIWTLLLWKISRIRLSPGIRCEVGARGGAQGRCAAWNRGHPVARRPGQQLRGSPQHAGGTGLEGRDIATRGGDRGTTRAAGTDDDAARGTPAEAVRDPLLVWEADRSRRPPRRQPCGPAAVPTRPAVTVYDSARYTSRAAGCAHG